jgi:heptosyltransferase-2
MLPEAFYKTSFSQAVIDSISPEEVYAAFLKYKGVSPLQKA